MYIPLHRAATSTGHLVAPGIFDKFVATFAILCVMKSGKGCAG